MKYGYVYILTNCRHTVLYIGVTSNLINRIHEHKTKLYKKSFTCKYNVDELVYYEIHDNIEDAIHREKKLKRSPRKRKINLINSMNPNWMDLHNTLFE